MAEITFLSEPSIIHSHTAHDTIAPLMYSYSRLDTVRSALERGRHVAVLADSVCRAVIHRLDEAFQYASSFGRPSFDCLFI